MKPLSATLFILCSLSSTAFADEDWCTFQENGKTESVAYHFWGMQNEILQLRFKGPVPDLYFSLSKFEEKQIRRIFTQFAARENAQSFLKVKTNPKTTVVVEDRKGGSSLTFNTGSSIIAIDCKTKK